MSAFIEVTGASVFIAATGGSAITDTEVTGLSHGTGTEVTGIIVIAAIVGVGLHFTEIAAVAAAGGGNGSACCFPSMLTAIDKKQKLP
jgi:hypothetical protein